VINISKCFKIFRNLQKVGESEIYIPNKYCVNIKTKRRYINPLVETDNGTKRIVDVSEKAKSKIEEYLNLEFKKYAYLDLEF